MIYRKYLTALPLVIVLLLSEYPPSSAIEGGYSGYGNNPVYYTLNAEVIRKEADDFFVKAYDSESREDKAKFYRIAMNKYYVLSQIYPGDYYAFVQMARINDERDEDTFARKNFFLAFNLDKYNPYINFYLAEYHIKRQM